VRSLAPQWKAAFLHRVGLRADVLTVRFTLRSYAGGLKRGAWRQLGRRPYEVGSSGESQSRASGEGCGKHQETDEYIIVIMYWVG